MRRDRYGRPLRTHRFYCCVCGDHRGVTMRHDRVYCRQHISAPPAQYTVHGTPRVLSSAFETNRRKH